MIKCFYVQILTMYNEFYGKCLSLTNSFCCWM